MGEKLEKLMEVASFALSDRTVDPAVGGLAHDLLAKRNGFLAFEGALLVPPSETNSEALTFEQWNRAEWRSHYPAWDRARVFGFDAFLDMFAEMDGQVVRLNPYTAEVEEHSSSLEEWASKLLGDYDYETGWSVAHAWQERNRRLRPDERLVPRTPFILGGSYDVDNVVAVSILTAIGPIIEIYEQLCDLPDGEQVQLHGWKPDSWAQGALPTTSTKL